MLTFLTFISVSSLIRFICLGFLFAYWPNSSTWTSSLQIQTWDLLFPDPQWENGGRNHGREWEGETLTQIKALPGGWLPRALYSIKPLSSTPSLPTPHPQLTGSHQDPPWAFLTDVCVMRLSTLEIHLTSHLFCSIYNPGSTWKPAVHE